MNRQEAKKLLPIIQAFAEGKTIQIKRQGEEYYYDSTDDNLDFNLDYYDYRIKLEPKYRPFANAEECWKEMQKHQPFGWLKNGNLLFNIISIGAGITVHNTISDCRYGFKHAFSLTFADGTPFGTKEEK